MENEYSSRHGGSHRVTSLRAGSQAGAQIGAKARSSSCEHGGLDKCLGQLTTVAGGSSSSSTSGLLQGHLPESQQFGPNGKNFISKSAVIPYGGLG